MTKSISQCQNIGERSEMRIPVKLISSVHPKLIATIEAMPSRYRSERMRVLMEKGLLYEEQSHLLAPYNSSSQTSDAHSSSISNDIKSEIRIPVRVTRLAHPRIMEAIEIVPVRFRSERMRILMEKGLLYEEQSYILGTHRNITPQSVNDDSLDGDNDGNLSDHDFGFS